MQDIAIYLNQNFNRSHGYDCANIVFTDEKGKKSSKMVEIGSLLRAFKKAVVETVELAPIGEIPFGYYNGAVGISNNKIKADIVTVLPASMQIMQYENTQYDVCVPSLVFSFHVDKGRLEKTRVFVLKDEKPTENSVLYRYPFGNVYDDGRVCWGSNVFPDILEIKRLEMVMTLFIQSPCNSDLYNSEKCIGMKDVTLRELFEQLHNKQNFPEEYLMPLKKQKRKMCLKDLMTWKNEGLIYDFYGDESSRYFLETQDSLKKAYGSIYRAMQVLKKPLKQALMELEPFFFPTGICSREILEKIEDIMYEKKIKHYKQLYEIMSAMKIFEDDTRIYYSTGERSQVRMLTAHDAKGKEFPAVIVYGIDNFECGDVEEDRRLLYVAVTRAKRVLFILEEYPGKSNFLKDIEKYISVNRRARYEK